MSATSIPGHALKGEIGTVVAAMASKHVECRFTGRRAFTDGLTFVSMPAISASQLYELESARVMRGYANHEVFHVLHSDTAAMPAFISRNFSPALTAAKTGRPVAPGRGDPAEPPSGVDGRTWWAFRLWKALANAIEDWRIEAVGNALLPGSKTNIGQTRAHINAREGALLRDGKLARTTPHMAVTMTTWKGAIENGYGCAAQAAANLQAATLTHPEDRAILEGFWPRASACRSHGEVNALAYEVAMELASLFYDDERGRERGPAAPGEDQEEDGQTEPGDGPGGEGGAPGCDGGDGEKPGQPHDRGRMPDGGEATGASGEGTGGERDGEGNSVTASTPSPGRDPASASNSGRHGVAVMASRAEDFDDDTLNIEDVIAQVCEATEASASSGEDVDTVRTLRDPRRCLVSYGSLLRESGAAASATAGALRRILKSKSSRRERHGLSDGDLDLGAIMGIATGQREVFYAVDAATDVDAAILLMLDNSGSMRECVGGGGTRKGLLAQAATSVVNAVAGNRGVATAIATWTTDGDGPAVKLHKGFDEPRAAAKGAAGAVPTTEPMGGTPSKMSILEGHRLIYRRREARKIMVFITDGETDAPDAALEAARTVIACGVTLIGMGIGRGAPAMPIPGWTTVANIAELPVRLLGAVAGAMSPAKP